MTTITLMWTFTKTFWLGKPIVVVCELLFCHYAVINHGGGGVLAGRMYVWQGATAIEQTHVFRDAEAPEGYAQGYYDSCIENAENETNPERNFRVHSFWENEHLFVESMVTIFWQPKCTNILIHKQCRHALL